VSNDVTHDGLIQGSAVAILAHTLQAAIVFQVQFQVQTIISFVSQATQALCAIQVLFVNLLVALSICHLVVHEFVAVISDEIGGFGGVGGLCITHIPYIGSPLFS
jgi:hypothetical protein